MPNPNLSTTKIPPSPPDQVTILRRTPHRWRTSVWHIKKSAATDNKSPTRRPAMGHRITIQ